MAQIRRSGTPISSVRNENRSDDARLRVEPAVGNVVTMDLGLEESVILITGGTDGLGKSLAAFLLHEGSNVVICGRDPERLTGAVDDLSALNGTVLGVPCDVRDPVQLEQLVEATTREFGQLDGLVNNAGAKAGSNIVDTSDEQWSSDIDLKLMAAVRLSRLVVPLLRASSHGAIVNVLSITAKAPGKGSAPTAVSRAAGMALTKELANELGPDGIRANAVLIGLIESGQWRRAANEANMSDDELYQSLAAHSNIPLQRVGKALEFAKVAAFLLSPASSYVTGTAINCDGGMSPVV